MPTKHWMILLTLYLSPILSPQPNRFKPPPANNIKPMKSKNAKPNQ